MKNDLKQCKLGDVASSQTGPFGSQLHEEDYVTEGTPIVTVEHLGPIGFTHQNLPFVSDEDTKRLSKYTLKEGDIVFSRVGSIDRSVYVKPEEEGWLFSGRCIRVRCNNTANPRYLSFYFRLPSFKKMMLDLSVGATMPSLNTEIMDNVLLYLPSKERQDAVAQILNDIDTKIENNNAICADLEGMAKLLYNYWFVQFDFPDENRMPYKSSGGKMVWNEELKREIPEGWEVKLLPDVCNVRYGFPLSTELYSDEGTPVIRIRDILDTSISAHTSEKVSDEYLTKLGDLLIGMDGNFQMNYWSRNGDIVNQRITRIRKTDLPIMLIRFQIEPFILAKVTTVARSTVGHLGDTDIKGLKIAVPNRNVDCTFFEHATQTICELRNENHDLASLRDFLLPMLMNGQVKVG